MIRLVAALLALVLAIPAWATPADDLKAIIDDHWRIWLEENVISATALGVRSYDNRLPEFTIAAMDKSAARARTLLDRLEAIPDAALDAAGRTNKAVLGWMLREQVEGNRFGQRLMLFTSYASPHQSFATLPENVPLFTPRDFESYVARLENFAKVNDQIIAIDRMAVARGFVQPCVAMTGYAESIAGAVASAPEATGFYAPFRRTQPPTGIPAEQWHSYRARALAAIRDVVTPAYRRYRDHYVRDSLPKCAKEIGVWRLPQGRAYYAYRVAAHTTTRLTPDQIHQIGLDEVARIGARMDDAARKAGFASRAEFAARLRSDPAYYATSAEALLAAAALAAKRIDGEMPRYFGRLPRLPYGVKAIPAATAEMTTTAYYGPGSPPSGIAGTFFVNTSKLDQRPVFELPALTAHEAVPGHHHQIALQQELALPEFRKNAAGFTAFVEGWGLYAEYLGEEMGLYDTPEKLMGRLSYEMWRACRLVVDTGIHDKGWTKPQAIAFMRANTALSDANIEAEVNRYISWPGQALGYKIGEIRFRELRARAERALGARFDLRRFHDAVLEQGAVPLDVLEAQVDRWIASEGGQASAAAH